MTCVSAMNKRLDEVNIKVFHAIAMNLKNFRQFTIVYTTKVIQVNRIASPFKSEEASNLTFNDDRQLSDC